MRRRGVADNSDSYVQVGPVVPFSFNVNVLFAGYEQCDPLHYAGPKYEHTYLLHVVLSGKGYFRCNSKEYHLQRGDIFLIRPNDYIYYVADDEQPWTYRWIRFNGSSVKYLLENSGITGQVFSLGSEEELNEVAENLRLVYEYMFDEIAPYLRATGMCCVVLGWFLRRFGEQRIASASANHMNFLRILNYVDIHFTENLSMNEIAGASSYNRSHIYKMFMKYVGCSPKEYINTLRLDLACQLIHENTYTITEISARAGFNSYVSFVNAFKKKYGMLPTQYRKEAGRHKEVSP